MLSGRLRLVLGDQDFVLSPGDVAEFSTWTPHWMGVVDEPTEIIAISAHTASACICSPTGRGRSLKRDGVRGSVRENAR